MTATIRRQVEGGTRRLTAPCAVGEHDRCSQIAERYGVSSSCSTKVPCECRCHARRSE